MITYLIMTLEIMGLRLVDFAKAVPKSVIGAVGAVMLISVGQPAQAATLAPAVLVSADSGGNPLSGLVGCPNIDFLAPVFPVIQDITGMLSGIILVAALIFMFIAGCSMIVAGRRSQKVADGIETSKNVGIGLGVVFVAIPVVLLLLWGAIMIFNPNCR